MNQQSNKELVRPVHEYQTLQHIFQHYLVTRTEKMRVKNVDAKTRKKYLVFAKSTQFACSVFWRDRPLLNGATQNTSLVCVLLSVNNRPHLFGLH